MADDEEKWNLCQVPTPPPPPPPRPQHGLLPHTRVHLPPLFPFVCTLSTDVSGLPQGMAQNKRGLEEALMESRPSAASNCGRCVVVAAKSPLLLGGVATRGQLMGGELVCRWRHLWLTLHRISTGGTEGGETEGQSNPPPRGGISCLSFSPFSSPRSPVTSSVSLLTLTRLHKKTTHPILNLNAGDLMRTAGKIFSCARQSLALTSFRWLKKP